jgi:hypothetical protein
MSNCPMLSFARCPIRLRRDGPRGTPSDAWGIHGTPGGSLRENFFQKVNLTGRLNQRPVGHNLRSIFLLRCNLRR